MNPALQPRRRGNDMFAELASRMRSPRHHATQRATAQASGSPQDPAHAPLSIAEDVAQWYQAAELNLRNMRANYGHQDNGAKDIRPGYLQSTASAVIRAAEQCSPSLEIKDLLAASLPQSIGGLPQLETLAILATECTELPDTIGDLANLITLVLAGNTRVTHLPESLGNLRRLEQLDLSDCKNLQALPNLGKLQQLQKLDLTGCTGLRELPASLSQLPAQCEVLVPCRLQAQLSRLRPPRQRAAQPVGPGGEAARPVFRPGRPPRPPHRPRQVANPQVIWKQRLAPFAREDGAKRFSQWMDAAYQRSQDRSNQDRDIEIEKMGQIVEAASQSSSFRGKLFRFADENLRVERDRETGNTAVGIQPQAFRGEGSAYALLQEHRISDVAGTSTGEARAILGNDLRAILQRGRVPPGLSLAPYFLARNPGPLLAAYIRHRDPQGSDLMDQSAKLAEKLLEAGASNDISEQDARNGKEDAKKALDMLLQDRYREVAEEVLSETRGRHPAHRRPRP